MEREISASLLKLRRQFPFFATLALYMDYTFSDSVECFLTDGRKTQINPKYFKKQNPEQRISSLVHITLHCALLHPQRCGDRELSLWNIAADIVVNGIIVESKISPPPFTAVEPRYSHLSVEQVYNRLEQDAAKLDHNANAEAVTEDEESSALDSTSMIDIPQENGSSVDEVGLPENAKQAANTSCELMQRLYPAMSDIQQVNDPAIPGNKREIKKADAYWKQALIKAQTVAKLNHKSQGELPAGLLREIDCVVNPQLDWRTILWRFMAKTPCDYSGFDRRFIHQGLYLEHLESDSLKIHIAVDSSGSITDEELSQLRAEVASIANCYGTMEVYIYFVDAEVHGPYNLNRSTSIPSAIGGGGTDFDVFFKQLENETNLVDQKLCIYLTDGFGEFPSVPPNMPVLWVVTSEGNLDFPFGEVTYLN